LRYFNVFGPRQDPRSQYAAVIPNFITALLNGRALTIFGDGEQSRDFTYVENVVEANVLAIGAADVVGRVYNIACGESTSLNRLVAEVAELLCVSSQVTYADPRPGDIRHSLADISRARTELGYEGAVGLKAGLAQSIDYLRAELARRVGEFAAT
jgi:nucleoside-diphosphate-sugar epimerase